MTKKQDDTDVTTMVEIPEKEELMEKEQEEVVDMFVRLREAMDYMQLKLMELAHASERNTSILHHLNNQLKVKDIFIEAVLDQIGREHLPEGMSLYSGEDYVHFRDDESVVKADFTDKAKTDAPKDETDGDGGA